MTPPLILSLRSELGWRGLPSPRSFRRWIELALTAARRKGVTEINVLITDAKTGLALNRQFRGRDYATNVLSFPADATPGIESPLLGDLALCAPVVASEAAQRGIPLRNHYAHLVIHGTLHLLGYDHDDERQAKRMEALETRLLARLGIPDPYTVND